MNRGNAKEVLDEQRSEEEKRRRLEETESELKENELGSPEWEAKTIREAMQATDGNMSKIKYKQEKLRLEGEMKKAQQELTEHTWKKFFKLEKHDEYMIKLRELVAKKNQAEFDYAAHVRPEVIL